MAGQVSASDFWAGLNKGARIAFPKLFTVETLSGNLTIDTTYGNLMRIDPGGASREATLPPLLRIWSLRTTAARRCARRTAMKPAW